MIEGTISLGQNQSMKFVCLKRGSKNCAFFSSWCQENSELMGEKLLRGNSAGSDESSPCRFVLRQRERVGGSRMSMKEIFHQVFFA